MTNWKIEAKFVTMEYRDVNISLSLKRLNKMTRSHICLLIQEKKDLDLRELSFHQYGQMFFF